MGSSRIPLELRLRSVGNVTKKSPEHLFPLVTAPEFYRPTPAHVQQRAVFNINDMWFKAISDLNIEYSMDGEGRRMWVRPVCGGAVWREQIVSIAPRSALLSLLTSMKQTQSDCSLPTSVPPETATTFLERNSLKLHKPCSKISEIGF